MQNKQLIVFSMLIAALSFISNCDSSPVNNRHKRSESCSINIYDGKSFRGDFLATSRDNGFSHVHIHEESIQTYGSCCWRLFK